MLSVRGHAKDVLSVVSFFRRRTVFELIAEEVYHEPAGTLQSVYIYGSYPKIKTGVPLFWTTLYSI